MARAKEDLSRLTLNQIEKLTGSTFRSVTKFLEAANIQPVEVTENCKYYDPKVALPVIFEAQGYRCRKQTPADFDESSEEELAKVLDPFIQRARKDRALANTAEFNLQVLKKKYLPVEEMEKAWGDLVTNFRIKIMSLAPTQTPTLFAVKNIKDFERKWDEINREALEELSQYDVGDDEAVDQEDS